MRVERWEQVNELFKRATQLPESRRARFLAEECAEDVELRAEVETLLEHDSGTDHVDDSALTSPLLRRSVADLDEGARLGQYRILRILGRGGMGTVYLAEQQSPRRQVALKVISSGLASAELRKRFELEAEVLGRFRHPGIAQIHEAGTAEIAGSHQPFFAMEFVEGQMLLEYAESRQLRVTDRLELVTRICDAVHHAHQHGVIHRDLKPGNILVDPSGRPKILDFGVARATGSDVQVTTIRTDVGQLVGTVGYMSPEQTLGDPTALDIRSDVYALGVVCYQLLAGRLPYDLAGKPMPRALQMIAEEEPTPLGSGRRTFDRDIETIVGKALEKEKTRRYQSAAEMAADIRRYLANEPINARPASSLYQLSKFARRNKAVVGGVAATILALAIGLVASLYERQQRQSAVAARSFQTAQLFAQRRAWRTALENYGTAEELGYPDLAGITLGRVEAWFALQDEERARAEVAQLSRMPSLPSRYRGKLLVLQGALDRDRWKEPSAGLDKLREALREDLDPVDRALAEYFLEPHLPTARQILEAARLAGRDSFLLDLAYGNLLFFFGDREASMAFGRLMQLRSPDDAAGFFYEYIGLLVQGDLEGAAEYVERPQLEKHRELLLAFRDILSLGGISEFDKLLLRSTSQNFTSILGSFKAVSTALARSAELERAGEILRFHATHPTVVQCLRRFIFEILVAGPFKRGEAVIQVLDELIALWPDRMFLIFRGANRMILADDSGGERDLAEACRASSLFPLRLTPLIFLLQAQYIRWKEAREAGDDEARAAVASRAKETLRSILAHQDLESFHLGTLAHLGTELGALAQASEAIARWEQLEPRGTDRLHLWQRRAELAFCRGWLDAARMDAERVLAADPDNQAMKELLLKLD